MCLASSHWVFFSLQVIFQTPWHFGENLRTPLRSWGFPFRFLMFDIFRRRLWSFQQFFSFTVHSAQAAEVFPYYWSTFHICAIRSCLRVACFLHSFLAVFWALLLPKGSLFSWGSKILGGTHLRLRAISWELLFLPSCFVFQWQRRSLGISSLVSYGITLMAIFPLRYIEEERIKKS